MVVKIAMMPSEAGNERLNSKLWLKLSGEQGATLLIQATLNILP